MIEIAILIGAAATIAILALVIVLVARPGGAGNLREQAARDAAEIRGRLDAFAKSTAEHERDIRADLAAARREQVDSAVQLRRELGDRLTQFQAGTQQALSDAQAAQRNELVQFGEQLGKLTLTVEQRLDGLRNENAQKLEQMRATVDEKLQATLEQRLGDSFRHVSERLEQVHRGLGEMQTLAAGVGDLKRVLQNVKTRGGWGEVQLGALLSDILTPQQYESNVEVMPGSGQRVEFAIRLPGRDGTGRPCWLPVDAKFPLADWQRLQDASGPTSTQQRMRARRLPTSSDPKRRPFAPRTSRRRIRPISRSCSCRPKVSMRNSSRAPDSRTRCSVISVS